MKYFRNVDAPSVSGLRVNGEIAEMFIVQAPEELMDLPPGQCLVLGEGSNVIISGQVRTPVVKLEFDDIKVISNSKERARLRVDAGVTWDFLVNFCCSNKLHGLEYLSLIPGTVGAAPIQNIGAYGRELSQYVHSLTVYDLVLNEFHEIQNIDCKFGYRSSIFQRLENLIIVSVLFDFEVERTPSTEYKGFEECQDHYELREAICRIRREKLPYGDGIGSLGSYFKNMTVEASPALLNLLEADEVVFFRDEPNKIKIATGSLLDRLGLKGMSVGPFKVYEKNALVITNESAVGEFADLQRLELLISQSVKDNYGLELVREPTLWRE